VQVDLNTRS